MIPTALSLETYLTTPYSPDCDYVDGDVLERNDGERDHSRMQMMLSGYLWSREKSLGIYVLIEQRVQTRPATYLVPDILVILRACDRTDRFEAAVPLHRNPFSAPSTRAIPWSMRLLQNRCVFKLQNDLANYPALPPNRTPGRN